jgi:hypothetical protein
MRLKKIALHPSTDPFVLNTAGLLLVIGMFSAVVAGGGGGVGPGTLLAAGTG